MGMLRSGPEFPPDRVQSPAQLRARALRVRSYARSFPAGDEARQRLMELADELDAQARRVEGAAAVPE